jgi:hypothetical protein
MKPIFLFSLPRSGSTFCQRILGAHEEISTVNEPHFLLPFLYAHKDYDVRSTYNHHYASWAVQDFYASLPNQEKDYFEALRHFTLQLYKKSADKNKSTYFLDKTPKYHFIVDEILQLFPEAKIIFLWRNPLSVVASIMQTWGDGGWNVYHFDVDLYQGIDRLTSAYAANQQRVLGIRYEDVVQCPEETWSAVFNYLELNYDPQVLTQFAEVKLEGRVTDPNSHQEKYQVIQQGPLDKWKKVLANPLRKTWCRRYLRWVGHERLALMGYDLEALLADVNALPSRWQHLERDLYRMPLGAAYHLFELQLMKQKFLKWRAGERFYMHN